MSARPSTARYDAPVAGEEDLMTVDRYLDLVARGVLTDSDGFGYAVKDGRAARASRWSDDNENPVLRPSRGIDAIPEDATHVVWFNK